MNFIDFTDPNVLPWLIPVGPLLAFFIITLATNRSRLIPATSPAYGGHHPDYDGMPVPVVTDASRVLSIVVGMSGMVMAWLISLNVIAQAWGLEAFGRDVFQSALTWMDTGVDVFRMGVLVDPLTTVMLFMVPLAATGIFIYSIGYMANDPRQARFFSLISLFAGAMLTLVVADNLLLLFVGWEVMGLCSYMLIGFWFEKPSAYRAAIKAFTTTRVADVFMLLGIAYLYLSTGTLNFRDIMYNPAPGAEVPAAAVEGEGEHSEAGAVAAEGEGEHSEAGAVVAAEGEGEHSEAGAVGAEGDHGAEVTYETWATRLDNTPALLFGGGLSAAGLIGILLIIGTVGKSAQFPLHVWLPDAMEGPTPVSAMIHAAAMVSAGVYAIIRMFPLFAAGGDPSQGVLTPPLLFMAVIGSVTALFAATIAVAQNDVKKVLAYSTISQLGFMVAALGIGAFVAATFHLITHAFFKALLFMASGAVIHGMEHGEHHVHEHHHDDEHDGLHGAALAHGEHGHDAHAHGATHEPEVDAAVEHSEHEHAPHTHFDPQDMMNMGGLSKTMPVTFITFLLGGLSLAGLPLITAGFWSKDEILAEAYYGGFYRGYLGAHALVFICLVLAATLTAFYTMRQIGLTFWGEARTEEAKHANLGYGVVSATMTLPLIVLAFFAVLAGFWGVPPNFPIFGALFSPEYNPFQHLIGATLLNEPATHSFNIMPVLFGSGAAIFGIWAGWMLYWRKPLKAGEPDPLLAPLGTLHTTLKNKYYFDELYGAVFVQPTQWFSRNVASEFIDRGIIDGFLHLTARVFTWLGDIIKVVNNWLIDGVGDGIPEVIAMFGAWFRRLQTGRVQQYILLAAAAALIIGLIFAVSTGILQAAGS